MKIKFAYTQVLAYPTRVGKFVLDTDASAFAISGALHQYQDGILVPLAFASNSMNTAQRNYCTTKRELLAVVVYVKKFKHFLLGSDFEIRTDHSALRWLLNFKDAEGMIGRWLAYLSEFGIVNDMITHRKGVDHINADCLSRIPVRRCQREDCGDCGAHNAVEDACLELASLKSVSVVNQLDFVSWASVHVRDAQQADKGIKLLVDLLTNKSPKPVRPQLSLMSREMRQLVAQWPQLVIVDGILCRWKIKGKNVRVFKQVFVPLSLRWDILFYSHSTKVAGHFGAARTVLRISSRYYWPGMNKDIRSWVATCAICQRVKTGVGMAKLPLTKELWGVRFARIALDIISGFIRTPSGNTCMIVIQDYYTKYTRVFPLPDQKALTCAEALVNGWILLFGCPFVCHSDQGRNFESDLWKEMCSLLEIHKTRTNPYRPESDGAVERSIVL